ncbi:MAG: hypothetical protein FJ253_11355, partial [Phycisphaerae bacterium]|nr:hypothetical protein [Phycisphaerae bacterium]
PLLPPPIGAPPPCPPPPIGAPPPPRPPPGAPPPPRWAKAGLQTRSPHRAVEINSDGARRLRRVRSALRPRMRRILPVLSRGRP